MRYLPFVILFFSLPSFGEETYACFEKGADDPQSEKLVIAESSGSWRGSDETWKFHSESDFCNVSGTSFRPKSGFSITTCFDRQGLTMHELWVQFSGLEGFEGEHFIAARHIRSQFEKSRSVETGSCCCC